VLVVRVGCCVSRVEFYVFSGLLFRHDVCDHVNDPHGKKNRKKGWREETWPYIYASAPSSPSFPFSILFTNEKGCSLFLYFTDTRFLLVLLFRVCRCVCASVTHKNIRKKRRERTKFRGYAPSRRHAPIRHPKPPRPESRPLCHSTAARLFVYISRPATLFRVISSTSILLYIYIFPPFGFDWK
jgi:hypothetical protein